MGILNKIRTAWKSKTTVEKINLILDVISGVGCGIGSAIVGDKICEGRNRLEKVCVKTAVAGLGLAAYDISSKALQENYGEPIGKLVEHAKARAAEEKMKEAVTNE